MLSKGEIVRGLVGFDISVDEVPHVGLVGFQVQLFVSGVADDLAQLEIVVKFLFDALDVGIAITGFAQFVRDIGIGTHQRDRRLVKRGTLRFMCLQVIRNLGIAAEIMDMLQLTLGRLHRLAEQRNGFQRIVQSFPAFGQAVLQQNLRDRHRLRCDPARRYKRRWRSPPF